MQPELDAPKEREARGLDLMAIPLVRRMLQDPRVQLVPRPVDEDWTYNRVTTSAKGWNPWSGQVFYAANSAMNDWLARPEAPLRTLNEGDLLLPEVMFAVHDYLHVWSTRLIQSLVPEHGFGSAPLNDKNAETHAFLTLLTEAAATAGVDYWFLSARSLNESLPVGSGLETLTVSYREADSAEHRRANPDLRVQNPAFFRWLCRLYTSGVAEGFRNDDLRSSPLTLKWIEKELHYGEAQRMYTRSWLSHLAGCKLYADRRALRAPVGMSQRWQIELVDRVGQALWHLVRDDEAELTPAAPRMPQWSAPGDGAFDARFDNLAALDDPFETLRHRGIAPESFDYLFAQAVSALDHGECGERLAPCLAAVKQSQSLPLLAEVVRHYPRVSRGDTGPRDLFFLA